MPELIQQTDPRLVVSHLAQTAYGTALTSTQLNAGKSFRPKEAFLGEATIIRAEEGPMAFTGHEWPDGNDERDIRRDERLALNLAMNSYWVGFLAAMLCGQVTSVQEGATGHYTHTSRPTNPLAASGVRDAKVTSFFVDSGSADGGRIKRVILSLALAGFRISAAKAGQMVAVASDWIGSGSDDPTATGYTIPALTSQVLFSP